MDILIKSFNRVYYLDRCLHSISVYLKNFTGHIYILDDGTPEVYLQKIQQKYPYLIILKSDGYEIKSKYIENRDYNLPEIIPTKFWYHSALNISDYFIVLEDDMWFTNTLDVAKLNYNCTKENIALLKLFWVSNTKVIGDVTIKNIDSLLLYKPIVQFSNPLIFKYVYTKHHRLWKKLISVLGLYSMQKELQYYTIYSVAGAVFKKNYYLNIWSHANNRIDEKQQLINSLKYYNKNKVTFGRTQNEVLKTGFMSSAFSKYTYPDFSIHDFNITLNEFWLLKSNLFYANLELDIDENEIVKILKLKNKSELYISQWQEWVYKFKEEFQKMGCNI